MRPGDDAGARRAFSLIELLAVLIVVSLAASVVLPRLPATGAMRVRGAAARTADRLSAAREQAILEGRTVRVDLRDGLPSGVRIAALDAGGSAVVPPALILEPDGDALPATATLIDDGGTRIAVVLPAGFAPAHIEEMP
jgi:prepilin-type N-terminal cleavage/methylation domain-containing protein